MSRRPSDGPVERVLDASALLAYLHLEPGAEAVAALWPATRSGGLSLGNRACLALAHELGVPAITADRAWVRLDVGVEVVVVRG